MRKEKAKSVDFSGKHNVDIMVVLDLFCVYLNCIVKYAIFCGTQAPSKGNIVMFL